MSIIEHIAINARDTHELGIGLGQLLTAGDIVLLHGDLGAGKTTFAQGIAVGAGVKDMLTSPTFTLISEYQTCDANAVCLRFFHLDLYRLENEEEVQSIGLEDLLESGQDIVVVEWPERATQTSSQDAILVHLQFAGNERRLITLSQLGHRERDRRILEAFLLHSEAARG